MGDGRSPDGPMSVLQVRDDFARPAWRQRRAIKGASGSDSPADAYAGDAGRVRGDRQVAESPFTVGRRPGLGSGGGFGGVSRALGLRPAGPEGWGEALPRGPGPPLMPLRGGRKAPGGQPPRRQADGLQGMRAAAARALGRRVAVDRTHLQGRQDWLTPWERVSARNTFTG